MKDTKKLVQILLLALLVVVIGVGIWFFTAQREVAQREEIIIGMSVPGLEFPFFVTMKEEAEAAAERLGVQIVFADALNDSAKQAADMETFIALGVDAILVSPITTDGLVPAIEQAVDAGIPVATVDRRADTDLTLAHVGADNIEGGRSAARFIIDQLGNRGTVIQLEGTPGASAAIERKMGFDEVMAASDVEILTSVTAEFSRARGMSVMEDLIETFPEFDAVFGANDEMIIGAIEAMEAADIDTAGKVTVGFDATIDALDYMQRGLLDTTIDQFPGQQASTALEILVEYIKTGNRPAEAIQLLKPQPII